MGVALARAEAVLTDNSGLFSPSSTKSPVLSRPNWVGGCDGLTFTLCSSSLETGGYDGLAFSADL